MTFHVVVGVVVSDRVTFCFVGFAENEQLHGYTDRHTCTPESFVTSCKEGCGCKVVKRSDGALFVVPPGGWQEPVAFY